MKFRHANRETDISVSEAKIITEQQVCFVTKKRFQDEGKEPRFYNVFVGRNFSLSPVLHNTDITYIP